MRIKLQNVEYNYNSSKKSLPSLVDINLEIDKNNEFLFILGQTGSGKSTLIQHLNLLLSPTKGKVDVFGINNKKFSLASVRKAVGLVFQFSEYQLFEDTVLKDVMFGPVNFGYSKTDAEQLAKEALSQVGIEEDLYERSPFSLSGGQMRKVAIAGILAYNPDVLVLDEPTVGLDLKSARQVMDLLVDLRKKTNKTIIVVSHNMDHVAEFATRVVVLNKAKILFDGKKEDLFSNENILEELSLSLPKVMQIAKKIKSELNISFNEMVFTNEELVEELEKYYGYSNREIH